MVKIYSITGTPIASTKAEPVKKPSSATPTISARTSPNTDNPNSPDGSEVSPLPGTNVPGPGATGTTTDATGQPAVPPRVTETPVQQQLAASTAPLEKLIYSDYAFEFTQFQLKNEINPQSQGWVNYENIYNFYIQGFEELAQLAPETSLPGLYIFLAEKDVLNRDPLRAGSFPSNQGPLYYKHITLNGKIQGTLIDKTFNNVNDSGDVLSGYSSRNGKRIVNGFIGTEKDKNSYYYEWTRAISETISAQGGDVNTALYNELPFLNSFKNIVIPFSSVHPEFLGDKFEYRRQFPMAVKLELKTEDAGFAKAFQDTKLGTLLIKEVIENVEITPIQDSQGNVIDQRTGTWNKWLNVDRVSRQNNIPGAVNQSYYRFWDIHQFVANLQNLTDGDLIKAYSNIYTYLYSISRSKAELETINRSGIVDPMNISIRAEELEDKINLLLSGHNDPIAGKDITPLFRTYNDILNGKTAYNETIFYRIEKVRVSDNTVVQNFYIPNSDDIDVVEYYDTQVRYGEEYTYKTYAYQLVIGNRYRFKVDNMPNPDGQPRHEIYTENADPAAPVAEKDQFLGRDWITFVNKMFSSNQYTDSKVTYEGEQVGFGSDALAAKQAEICVFSEPHLILVEVPQISFTTTIADKPPISPDVEIYPYRGISNKIGINFNTSVGERKEPFISLTPEDDQMLEKYKLNQKTSFNFIEFKTDDPSLQYEVWRTDKEPTSWTDFNFLELVDSSQLFSDPNKKSSGASLDSEVVPNKKYYYTFRSVDVHGNVSNPTSIFEIRVNDDKGAVWLDIKTYPEPKDPKILSKTKEARKYIQIKPSFIQSVVNEKASGVQDPETGERVQSVNSFNLTNETLALGQSDLVKSVWSDDDRPEKFRMRLTSKKTGRKIDLNFYCKVKHIKNPEK